MERNEIETKSAERLAFDYYLRTGRRLAEPIETKFNPNHDPANGQFSSGTGGSAGGARGGNQATRLRVRPIKGYPETGKDSWRKANDAVFEKAADDWNKAHGLKPGDPRYMDPQFMKAWAMVESGGDKQAFQTDPFQVNNPGPDWDDDKSGIGLHKGEKMTPSESARAALLWLDKKSYLNQPDSSGVLKPRYIGIARGLERYNGNVKLDANGLPHKNNYPKKIYSLYVGT